MYLVTGVASLIGSKFSEEPLRKRFDVVFYKKNICLKDGISEFVNWNLDYYHL